MRSSLRRVAGVPALAGLLLIPAVAGTLPARAAGGASISIAVPGVTATSSQVSGAGSGVATGLSCQVTAASRAAEAQLLSLLNQDRASATPPAPALALQKALSAAARYHSCDMFLHQTLSHTGSNGSSPYQRMAAVGFTMPPFHQEGENIGDASGYPPATAVSVLNSAMMAEPLTYGDHHWNIVNPGYSDVGVGIIVANGQTWLTEDFAG